MYELWPSLPPSPSPSQRQSLKRDVTALQLRLLHQFKREVGRAGGTMAGRSHESWRLRQGGAGMRMREQRGRTQGDGGMQATPTSPLLAPQHTGKASLQKYPRRHRALTRIVKKQKWNVLWSGEGVSTKH
ncbi:hypothetical protein E2C01_061537 [Portunus trituberculatus]|uniref:Uncharacterized protein n=1 Tax=Portunus trituberculatus TaxID=210409 RepID=A0A5B7H8E5_PORTR|nr:hypothetical protein [Portunus trituberculatus]